VTQREVYRHGSNIWLADLGDPRIVREHQRQFLFEHQHAGLGWAPRYRSRARSWSEQLGDILLLQARRTASKSPTTRILAIPQTVFAAPQARLSMAVVFEKTHAGPKPSCGSLRLPVAGGKQPATLPRVAASGLRLAGHRPVGELFCARCSRRTSVPGPRGARERPHPGAWRPQAAVVDRVHDLRPRRELPAIRAAHPGRWKLNTWSRQPVPAAAMFEPLLARKTSGAESPTFQGWRRHVGAFGHVAHVRTGSSDRPTFEKSLLSTPSSSPLFRCVDQIE